MSQQIGIMSYVMLQCERRRPRVAERKGGRKNQGLDRYTFWLDPKECDFMQRLANEAPEGLTLTHIVRRAIHEFVEREKSKQKGTK